MGSGIGTTTPLQAYPTADGDIVVGAASNPLFRRLAEVVVPELVDDPDYATQAGRIMRREQLNALLGDRFMKDTSDAWLQRLDAAGIPNARIRDLAEATERHRAMSRTGTVGVSGVPGMHLVANPMLPRLADLPPRRRRRRHPRRPLRSRVQCR
jgi:crotonobetainyl-CoA:carnitine CoA-transferase CaiB-like acyl-CoA transferase